LEISSSPDKFKCWPCSVRYFLSLFLTFFIIIDIHLLSACLTNFNTSLLTLDEGIRSCLRGDFIITIFPFFTQQNYTHAL
jgi:hypothetical protein